MRTATYYFFTLIFLLSGCTNLQSLQDLQVDLIKIEPDTMQSISPRFTLHLLITNPNAQDLEIEGMNFQLFIADHQVLSGVSNELPILKAYSETAVSVSTSFHLLDLLKLIAFIGNNGDKSISYQLNTSIDPKGYIAFNLHHEGVLNELFLESLKLP